jgi:MFS family permease
MIPTDAVPCFIKKISSRLLDNMPIDNSSLNQDSILYTAECQESRFNTEIERNHKRNSFFLLADGFFNGIGFAALNPYTIMVGYLQHLTDNQLIINSIISIGSMIFWTQIIGAWLHDSDEKKQGPMIKWSGMHRVFLSLLVISVFVFRAQGRFVIPFFLLFYACALASAGMAALLFTDLFGRWIRSDSIGAFFGVRLSLQNTVTIASGFAVAAILTKVPFPYNYEIVFSIGLGAYWLSFFSVCFTREAVLPSAKTRKTLPAFLIDMVSILKQDNVFFFLLLALVAGAASSMSEALFTTVSIKRFLLDAGQSARDAYAGQAGLILGASMVAGGLTASRICRAGKSARVLVLSYALSATAAIIAWQAPSLVIFRTVFVFTGFAMSFYFVSNTDLLFKVSVPENRIRYLGLTSFGRGTGGIMFPMLGGLIANTFGPNTAFAFTAFCMGLALLMAGAWIMKRKQTG